MGFKIGNIEIKNKVILAPMAGISNPAFIKIVASMGLGLAYTELISTEAIIRDNKKTFDMLNGIDKLPIPVGVQLFGSSAKNIAKAAKIITNLYPNIFIDINMGCPVPKVALRSQAGAALLKDSNKVYEIVKEVVESVNCPVTVKIRSGWDNNSINAVEIAKKIEEAGASAITVHPRTRSQGYSGKADYTIIKKVKDSVNIPVIGNGDIKSGIDAKRMLDETGCDAVMIGRGVLGNPWLIKEVVTYLKEGIILDKPNLKDKVKMIEDHFKYLLEIKCEKVAVLELRCHVSWYLKGISNMNDYKIKFNQAKTKEEVFQIINELNNIV